MDIRITTWGMREIGTDGSGWDVAAGDDLTLDVTDKLELVLELRELQESDTAVRCYAV